MDMSILFCWEVKEKVVCMHYELLEIFDVLAEMWKI